MNNAYASLKARLIAMIYESLLVAAVTFVGLVVAAPFAFVLREWPVFSSTLIALILLWAWRWYFVGAWRKKEQTLAMKTWNIVLKSANGQRASRKQLNLRFIWATLLLLLIPSAVYLVARHYGHEPKSALVLGMLWWILPWGWALLNRERQFLYDVLAGTALFSAKKPEKA
ncbi:MAG: RDD family protein [Neisseria sp.]|nr:RDD family protein [Neisseria sp.]